MENADRGLTFADRSGHSRRKLQLARLLTRDGITPELADAILDAQATREQRLAIADDVVRNEGSLVVLDDTVRALHERYSAFARQRSP